MRIHCTLIFAYTAPIGGGGGGRKALRQQKEEESARSKAVFTFLKQHHSKLADCVVVSDISSSDEGVPAVRSLLAVCSPEIEKKVLLLYMGLNHDVILLLVLKLE